ncbi:MAG: acyl-CoA dehydrogenase family protein, partial [Methanomassiliicoccales archaeon]|nr:acyl-CoA dehydrogenase family protein [Methanomassiliicoccales archaeon]
MVSTSDLRKKYLGAIGATEEDMEIALAVREFVDREVMPYRQDLDGGWHRDEKLARKTFHRIHQGLVDIGYQRASFPERYGGLGVGGITSYMIREEVSR